MTYKVSIIQNKGLYRLMADISSRQVLPRGSDDAGVPSLARLQAGAEGPSSPTGHSERLQDIGNILPDITLCLMRHFGYAPKFSSGKVRAKSGQVRPDRILWVRSRWIDRSAAGCRRERAAGVSVLKAHASRLGERSNLRPERYGQFS